MIGSDAIGRMALGQFSTGSNKILSADVGVFAENCGASNFKLLQVSGAISYSYAGNTVSFRPALNSSSGTYAETGNAATFRPVFSVSDGTYTLTGKPANVTILEAEGPGAYSFTGNAAFLNPSISAGSIAYIVTGNAANFTRDFVNWLPAKPINGSWSGEAAPISVWTNKSAPATPWTPEFTAPH